MDEADAELGKWLRAYRALTDDGRLSTRQVFVDCEDAVIILLSVLDLDD